MFHTVFCLDYLEAHSSRWFGLRTLEPASQDVLITCQTVCSGQHIWAPLSPDLTHRFLFNNVTGGSWELFRAADVICEWTNTPP